MSSDVNIIFLRDVSGSNKNQTLKSNESILLPKSSIPAPANIGLFTNRSGIKKGSSSAFGVQSSEGNTEC